MSIIRVNKTKNYTVMSNYHLNEKNMSLKAKGLLSLMLSLPDDWDYSVSGLVALCKESKTSIQSTLKELEEFRYLVRTRVQGDNGRFDYIYDIFEKPDKEPRTENLVTDNQCTDNVPQLNTKELNTKKLNTKKENERKKEQPPKSKNKTFDEIIDSYTSNEELRTELKEHLRIKKAKKAAMTNRSLEINLSKLDKFSKSEEEKIEIVQEAIANGWTTFYPLREFNKQNKEPGNRSAYDIDEYDNLNAFD